VQPDDFSHDEKPPVVSERLRLELALLKSRSSESKRGAGEKRRSVAMLRHALHGDATLRTVPVVLVTGGTVDVVEPGAAMRVDAVLEMPFNARRMHALIRNLLPRRAAGKPSENEARKP
jgi:hypothetical protein